MATAPASAPGINMRNALLSLGFLIASGMAGFIAQDVIPPKTSEVIVWILMILAVIFIVLSFVFALNTLIRTIRELKGQPSNKNYGAAIISGIVLLLIIYEAASRTVM